MRFYASLVGPMMGAYYPLPPIEKMIDEFGVHHYNNLYGALLNHSRLKSLWCAIYTEDEVNRHLDDYPNTFILPSYLTDRLWEDHDHHAVWSVFNPREVG